MTLRIILSRSRCSAGGGIYFIIHFSRRDSHFHLLHFHHWTFPASRNSFVNVKKNKNARERITSRRQRSSCWMLNVKCTKLRGWKMEWNDKSDEMQFLALQRWFLIYYPKKTRQNRRAIFTVRTRVDFVGVGKREAFERHDMLGRSSMVKVS